MISHIVYLKRYCKEKYMDNEIEYIDLELSKELYLKNKNTYDKNVLPEYQDAATFAICNSYRIPSIIFGYMIVETADKRKLAVRKCWNNVPKNRLIDISYVRDEMDKYCSARITYMGINEYNVVDFKHMIESMQDLQSFPVSEDETPIIAMLKKEGYEMIGEE